jgi:hypothetical protein
LAGEDVLVVQCWESIGCVGMLEVKTSSDQ